MNTLTALADETTVRLRLHVLVHEIAPWLTRPVQDLAPTIARATVAG